MDDFLILLQAKLDEAKSKGNINSDIDKIQNQIDKLKVQAEVDPKAISNLIKQLEGILNQKINISNVNFDQSQISKTAQQVGQNIGNRVAQSISSGVNKASSSLKSFSELKIGTGNISAILDKNGILDIEQSLNKVKQIYSEFGQVKITNKIFDPDGSLQQFRVDIQQVNGELKESRNFMMALSSDGKSFTFPQDIIKGSESFVHHLNEAKNITNATGEELNAQKARLAEQEKYYSKIKSEVNLLYNLEQKLLSADELQTAELEKQIKSTKQRIIYNNQQIDKKNLRDSSLDREINDLEVAKQKQLALSSARVQDIANAQIQAQTQKEVNRTLKEQQFLQSQVDKIKLSMEGKGKVDYNWQIDEEIKKLRNLGFTEEETSQKVKILTDAHTELKNAINGNNFDSIESKNRAIIKSDEKRTIALNQVKNAYRELKTDASQYYNLNKQTKLSTDIQNWLSKNSRASKEAKQSLQEYYRELGSGRVSVDRLNYIEKELKTIDAEQRGLGKLGKSLTDQFKQAAESFTQWASVSSAIMGLVYKTKQAVTELKEVNTYLTEISKANDRLSKADLTRIGNNSFATASKYGKKSTDYLSGVQEASRAGYEDAEGIAELSVAAQGAGDMTADLSNQMIIATDKAYKMNGSVEKLTATLDGMNYITNHNAVNMTELSEGMSIVGSTAASFGIEVNETTAALGTMIATTQQSGSEMARAFRAILLNIRQVSDEEEGIDAEGLTKYEKACNALGVSLKETKNGILQTRDAMDVLKDLSIEYNKLEENDLRRTELLNSVGGKLRANALDAILKNYDMYSKMLDEYAQGTGSMAVEAEKTAKSWEGVSNRVSNIWTSIVNNVANSDAIIDGTTALGNFLEVINKLTSSLGSLGTIGLGAGIFAGFKNVGSPKMFGLNNVLNIPTVC